MPSVNPLQRAIACSNPQKIYLIHGHQWPWLCVWERRSGETIPNTIRNKSVRCIPPERPPRSVPLSHCELMLRSSGST